MSIKGILEQHDQEQSEKYAESSTGDYKPFNFFVRANQTARVMFISPAFEASEGRNMYGLLDRQKFVKDNHSFSVLDEMENLEKTAKETYIKRHKLVKLGVATVIDIGQVTFDNKGNEVISGYKSADGKQTYLGNKRLMIGKLGSADFPTAIRKLLNTAERKIRARENGLEYTVWDIGRSGAKTDANGDSFEFVTAFDNVTDALNYLKSFGVKAENVKLTVYPVEDAVSLLDQVDVDLAVMKAQKRIAELDELNSAEPTEESEAEEKPKAKGKRK